MHTRARAKRNLAQATRALEASLALFYAPGMQGWAAADGVPGLNGLGHFMSEREKLSVQLSLLDEQSFSSSTRDAVAHPGRPTALPETRLSVILRFPILSTSASCIREFVFAAKSTCRRTTGGARGVGRKLEQGLVHDDSGRPSQCARPLPDKLECVRNLSRWKTVAWSIIGSSIVVFERRRTYGFPSHTVETDCLTKKRSYRAITMPIPEHCFVRL